MTTSTMPGCVTRRLRRAVFLDAWAVIGGLIVLAVCSAIAHGGTVPGWEHAAFRAVNDLPGAFYPVFAAVQQLGGLAVGFVVAAGGLLVRNLRLALAAVAATTLKLVGERLIKAVLTRERPATSIGSGVHVRGDVPLAGESFVSGHAALVVALAGVVLPYLRGWWKAAPVVAALAVLFARVYVGAHNPLDVIGGAGLGAAIAGVVNLAVGPRHTGGTR